MRRSIFFFQFCLFSVFDREGEEEQLNNVWINVLCFDFLFRLKQCQWCCCCCYTLCNFVDDKFLSMKIWGLLHYFLSFFCFCFVFHFNSIEKKIYKVSDRMRICFSISQHFWLDFGARQMTKKFSINSFTFHSIVKCAGEYVYMFGFFLW